MFEFENGCEKQETLEMYNMFMSSPHVTRCTMMVNEEPILVGLEPYEELYVEFIHYEAPMSVIFNVETRVGGLTEMTIQGDVPIGIITTDKLMELFNSMPHIKSFVEDEGEVFH